MPIYPPHYWYAKRFIKTYKKYNYDKQTDLYFIFSNKAESKLFWKREYKIIVGDELVKPAISRGGVINLKKFYALNKIKDLYKYTIIIDSESEMCREVNLLDVCEPFFRNKILYWNKTRSNTENIIKSCSARFKKPITKDMKNLYLRFNQICVYKNDTLEDFFKKTWVIKKIDNIKFEDFDYYIYMFYLLYFSWFKIYDIWCLTDWWFCETWSWEIELNNMNYKNIQFNATTKYVENKFGLKPFIHIQIDRDWVSGKKRFLYNSFKLIYNWIFKCLSK